VCESGSLFDLYNKQGRKFDKPTAHRLAKECAVGYQFIHDLGFMHRDIKSLYAPSSLSFPSGRFNLLRPLPSSVRLILRRS
jgi:serine/threonine protein kinase